MNKIISIASICLLCLISITIQAQNRSVEFEHSKWKKVLKKAKKENKLIFVDCYTSWCGPCKMMAKKVFTQDHVADYFNSNFVNYKIDMEKGEGPELKPGWKINAYPTFLLINKEGEVVHRVVGAYKADEFINYIKDGQSNDRSFAALTKAYESGKRDGEFMFYYLRALRLANLDNLEAEHAKEYFSTLAKAELLKKDSWNAVKYFLNDPLTDEFRYIVENREQLSTVVGEKEVEEKIYKSYMKKVEAFAFFYPAKGKVFDKEGFDHMISDLQKFNFFRAKELIAIALKNEYARLNDWKKYAYVVNAALDFSLMKNNTDQYRYFDSAAKLIAKVSKEKEMLQDALRWVSYACEQETKSEFKSGFLATKAKVLELLGDADEASKTKLASQKEDQKAEEAGTKIISIPMVKMGGMKPAKK